MNSLKQPKVARTIYLLRTSQILLLLLFEIFVVTAKVRVLSIPKQFLQTEIVAGFVLYFLNIFL